MTTYRREIASLDELAADLQKLADDWDDIVTDAVKGALIDGGYMSELMIRIPKSERARYASQLTGEGPDGTKRKVMLQVSRAGKADGTGWKYKLPSQWPKRFGVNAADATRVQEYGNSRLQKSVIPDGNREGAIQVRTSSGAVDLVMGSNVEYAARVYNAKRPREGEYWTPGRDTGWSTPRTGNRFFEVAYDRAGERVTRAIGRNITRILQQRGLL